MVVNEETNHSFNVKIFCTLCRKFIQLEKVIQGYQLSNYYKHVQKCVARTAEISKIHGALFKCSLKQPASSKQSTSDNASPVKQPDDSGYPVMQSAHSDTCSQTSNCVVPAGDNSSPIIQSNDSGSTVMQRKSQSSESIVYLVCNLMLVILLPVLKNPHIAPMSFRVFSKPLLYYYRRGVVKEGLMQILTSVYLQLGNEETH